MQFELRLSSFRNKVHSVLKVIKSIPENKQILLRTLCWYQSCLRMLCDYGYIWKADELTMNVMASKPSCSPMRKLENIAMLNSL